MKLQKSAHLLQLFQVAIVSAGIVALLPGCSSQLRTTMVSGPEAQKIEKAQLEAESFVPEMVKAQAIIEEKSTTVPVFDIPVEEPARPVIRPTAAPEIFSASKALDSSNTQNLQSDTSSSPIVQETPVIASATSASESSSELVPRTELSMKRIPPVSFEPELPALPTLRHENDRSAFPENSEMSNAGSDDVSLGQEQAGQIQGELPINGLVEEPKIVAQADVVEENDSAASAASGEDAPMLIAKVVPQEARDAEITTEALEVALSDVYFDYDQFAIREDASAALKANAQLLTGKLAGKSIVIEGHCDERGTQSYNIVLGERRAKAVKRFLQDLGVPEENLQIVTFGKDKPFCLDQTETCRQENRRGHFVIRE